MKKLSLAFMLAMAVATLFVSCKKEEQLEIQPASVKAPSQDTITHFYVYFSDPIDSSTEVGAYEDPDGSGPMEACYGGVSLKANTHYIVTFMLEDASNPEKIVSIDKKIMNNGKDYKICISNPLGMSIIPSDSDGSMPIGLVNDLNTSSVTGNGSINFSIKYQKGVKNGQCEPGVVLYNCTLPISVY